MDFECSKCRLFLDPSCFARDKNKAHGLDYVCKSCRREYRQKNKDKELARWKRNYAPGTKQREKAMVRSQTRRKYGSAKKYKCFLPGCESQAEEWHHIKYETDSVVALCSNCHERIT